MTFIGQIVLPAEFCSGKSAVRAAYIFMTGAGFDTGAVQTWDPEEGETRVVVQAAARSPTGPTDYPDLLMRYQGSGAKRQLRPCEYAVVEVPAEESEYMSLGELDSAPAAEQERIMESWRGNKIGGSPFWVQGEECPFKAGKLLLQLEDGSYPFHLNLGTGVGYVFLNAKCTEAKLLWQC